MSLHEHLTDSLTGTLRDSQPTWKFPVADPGERDAVALLHWGLVQAVLASPAAGDGASLARLLGRSSDRHVQQQLTGQKRISVEDACQWIEVLDLRGADLVNPAVQDRLPPVWRRVMLGDRAARHVARAIDWQQVLSAVAHGAEPVLSRCTTAELSACTVVASHDGGADPRRWRRAEDAWLYDELGQTACLYAFSASEWGSPMLALHGLLNQLQRLVEAPATEHLLVAYTDAALAAQLAGFLPDPTVADLGSHFSLDPVVAVRLGRAGGESKLVLLARSGLEHGGNLLLLRATG